jgi:tRNA 2-thiocytidine biosynthesis protein TtcA
MSHSASPSRQSIKLDEATEQLQTKLLRLAGETIGEYGLIKDGDKIMVCLSGGKDSHARLDLLLVWQRRAPIHFDLVAVNLDQKQPGFPDHVLPDNLSHIGVPFPIEERDTYSIVKRLISEGQTTCSLCSRLRRGILYRVATGLGATKIALGHHRDDIVETLSLNLFYTGKLKTMPPKLRSKDGRHLIIRPLAAVRENDLARYVELRAFPIIPCDLCGSQEDLKWKEVKKFLREWEQRSPGCPDSMFAARQTWRRRFSWIDGCRLRGSARIRSGGGAGRRLVGSRPCPILMSLTTLPNRMRSAASSELPDIGPILVQPLASSPLR